MPLPERKRHLRDAKVFFDKGLASLVVGPGESPPPNALRLHLSRAEAAKVR